SLFDPPIYFLNYTKSESLFNLYTFYSRPKEQATKLDRELDRLQILLINQTPHSKDYDKIAGEFNKVQQQRDELQLTLDRQNEVVQKNVNLQNFIDTNSKQLNEFDEHLVRQLIKKITIQETYCEVEFQNGDSIKINL
ncbi:hypothetical protein, partial [Limosilactobacillus fermentum]